MLKNSGREADPRLVDSSTTVLNLTAYREARRLWEMEKVYHPEAELALFYQRCLESEAYAETENRVFYQAAREDAANVLYCKEDELPRK